MQSKTALLVSDLCSLLDLETRTGSELRVKTLSVNLAEFGSLVITIFTAMTSEQQGFRSVNELEIKIISMFNHSISSSSSDDVILFVCYTFEYFELKEK